MYDFANISERGEWLDTFIALIQYLKSGEAKVGYLNRLHPKNALHRVSTSTEVHADLGRRDEFTKGA